MQALKTLAVAVFTSLTLACANSVSINTDYLEGTDFSHLKTYRWYDDVYPSRTAKYRSYNSSDKLMRETINRMLKQEGYRPNTLDGGEFLVNYRIAAEAKMNPNSVYNEPGVHGGVSTGTYGTSVAIGVSGGSSGPTYYKEGTVVIDILDASDNKLMWRAVAEGRLPNNMGLKERNEIIHELVPKMLKDFPPQ